MRLIQAEVNRAPVGEILPRDAAADDGYACSCEVPAAEAGESESEKYGNCSAQKCYENLPVFGG